MGTERSGILYCQIGTPSAPESGAVRAFLKEFLSDPNIVPADTFWWPLVLHGLILPFRSPKVARRYRQIWRADGSPLRVFSALQAQSLRAALGPQIPLAAVNCYGSPDIKTGVAELLSAGVTRILIFSAYPHPSRATSGAFESAARKAVAACGAAAEVRLLPPFFTSSSWLEAVSQRINETLRGAGSAEYLLLSYHGVPLKSLRSDDSYPRSCEATTAALKGLINMPAERVIHCYQSRFGFGRWTGPCTDRVIRELAQRGVKRLTVACPGFNCDCLETLYDVGMVFREGFVRLGGEELELVPGLNERAGWLEQIACEIKDRLP